MPSPTNKNEITTEQQLTNDTQQELRELQQLWKELGMSSSQFQGDTNVTQGVNTPSLSPAIAISTNVWQPILCLGFGTAVLFNIGILCSLPPVLRGRGAPYLPTYEKNMIHMFQQLRNEPQFMKQYHRVVTARNTSNRPSTRINRSGNYSNNNNDNENKIVFVDLGSGDGRIVFHAAYREQLFTNCIGYEINPFLHGYAILKQQLYKCYSMLFPPQNQNTPSTPIMSTTTIPSPRIGSIQTEFHLRDLWNVNLQNVNVVAVYGLGPIMKELGQKLQHELPHGSYVLSNVFKFPDWTPLPDNSTNTEKTFIYRIPDCYDAQKRAVP